MSIIVRAAVHMKLQLLDTRSHVSEVTKQQNNRISLSKFGSFTSESMKSRTMNELSSFVV